MKQVVKSLAFLMVGIVVFDCTAFAQEEGKLTGAFRFEAVRNRLFARYYEEEGLAIRMLENELAYRKIRYQMLELGAKNRGISLQKDDSIELPVLTIEENGGDAIRRWMIWWHYLGRESEQYLQELKLAATEMVHAKSGLLSAQIKRLQVEQELEELLRDDELIMMARAPVAEEPFFERHVKPRNELIEKLKEQRAAKEIALERISETSVDLRYIQDEMSKIIEK